LAEQLAETQERAAETENLVSRLESAATAGQDRQGAVQQAQGDALEAAAVATASAQAAAREADASRATLMQQEQQLADLTSALAASEVKAGNAEAKFAQLTTQIAAMESEYGIISGSAGGSTKGGLSRCALAERKCVALQGEVGKLEAEVMRQRVEQERLASVNSRQV